MLSAGCKKYDGVPVDDKVAAIFLPIRPDLPIPVMITLPLQEYKSSIALSKLSPILSINFKIESASIFNTSFARSFIDFTLIILPILYPHKLIIL